MNSQSRPTVFIIEDDLEMCNSLRWLMDSVQLNSEVFNNPNDFLKKHNLYQSGCILLDVRMPEMNGLEVLAQLKNLKNHLPVIIITGHGDIPMAVRAMQLGAKNFITKPFSHQDLINQVQNALNQHLSNPISFEYEASKLRFNTLSKREVEVLYLIIDGKSNKQIAEGLSIAVPTVESHRARLMRKMEAKNTAHLVNMISLLKP
jgi:two-component system response regulator FixJ